MCCRYWSSVRETPRKSTFRILSSQEYSVSIWQTPLRSCERPMQRDDLSTPFRYMCQVKGSYRNHSLCLRKCFEILSLFVSSTEIIGRLHNLSPSLDLPFAGCSALATTRGHLKDLRVSQYAYLGRELTLPCNTSIFSFSSTRFLYPVDPLRPPCLVHSPQECQEMDGTAWRSLTHPCCVVVDYPKHPRGMSHSD